VEEYSEIERFTNLPAHPRLKKIYPSSVHIMKYFISRKISFPSEGYALYALA
jgi:hypothetical protein